MPIHTVVTFQHALDLLNEVVLLDPVAAHALIEHRVPCNDGLAQHPTVQVAQGEEQGTCVVGLLGILNGLFGTDSEGWGILAAVFDEQGQLVRFERSQAKIEENTWVST
jgi:hypothetical protein